MTALDRAILAHIFNSKTQPVSLDELVRVTNAERTEVLLAVGELHGKGYLTVTFRMTCYGMAMTYLSCVVRDAGKKVSCGSTEGRALEHGRSPRSSQDPKECSALVAIGDSGYQAPPAGKHFALSSGTGAESGKGAEPPSSISAPPFFGPAVSARAVDKVLANHGLCPQGPDCIDDPTKVVRIHKCDSCAFKGCIKCVMDHEREPHWSDSDTARERFGGMTLVKGGKL